ncbi:MAG: dihydropteroate synthase, partial [Planctomycetota bacterium]
MTYFKRPQITIDSEGAISISGPCLMGILNVTPDSFSDGGKYGSIQEVTEMALRFAEAGAQILDIGGESSRPGSQSVPLVLELERVLPVIESIRKYTSVYLSIDTTKAEVAKQALQAGANIINDISACRQDLKMWQVALQHPLILMHMRGEPRTMQEQVYYEEVVNEIYAFFEERLSLAHTYGLRSKQIILDPGIGFGKHPEHNLK